MATRPTRVEATQGNLNADVHDTACTRLNVGSTNYPEISSNQRRKLDAMRDVSAGRDIVNSPIIEIVGSNPSLEILQQPAEELAAAEKVSRRAVFAGRKRRAKRAAIFSAVALVGLVAAGLLGYFWLLDGGKIGVQDIIRDSSNVVLAAVVSTAVSALVAIVFGAMAFWQKDPTDAEKLNSGRLRNISTRWDELSLLGFPKSEMRQLRKRS